MNEPQQNDPQQNDIETHPRQLSPEAQRALQEAQQRRDVLDQRQKELAQALEINGRGGLDPVRYTDWENKGIACDF